MPVAARIVWLATGLAWAASSLVQLAGPRYWDAATALDYLAVYSFSAAWILLAASALTLGRVVPRRAVVLAGAVVAVAAFLAGTANLVEDGFGLKAWGTLYVIGALGAWLALLPLAFVLWRGGPVALAVAPALTFLGFAAFPIGGGLLVLVGWGAPAIRSASFLELD
jgi:hypothetical protein